MSNLESAMEGFGNRIKLVFASKGYSQRRFAEETGMNHTHVNKFFNSRKPTLEFLQKVTDIFPDVDLRWLLFGSGEETSVMLVTEPTQSYGPKMEEHIETIEESLKAIRNLLTQE